MNIQIVTNEAGRPAVLREDGKPIAGVTGARITLKADDIVRAELDIIVSKVGLYGEGKAYFDGREVSRIIYADGGEEEF